MGKRLGIVAVLVVLAEALSAGVGLAQDKYGAIATSESTSAWGLTYNYGNRADAEDDALEQCTQRASDCQVRVWFKNSCGAVAENDDSISWGLGDSRAEAESEALSALDGTGKIIAWSCTDR